MASLIGPKSDVALAEAAAAAGAEVGVCVGGQRQQRRQRGDLRRRGGGRPGDREGQGARRPGDPGERLGALPLPADAAGRRRDGRGAGRGRDRRAARRFLVANVTARPTNDPEAIRRQLVEQVTGRVRWRESIEWLAGEGGVTRFAELGAGKVLTGMVKRIAPDAEARGAERAGRPRSLRQEPLRELARCSIFPARRRWSPAPPAASAARSPGRCMPRAPTWCCPAPARRRWPSCASELGERASIAPANLSRGRAGRRPGGGGRGGRRHGARHPGLQRRRHPRRPRAAHEGRGLAQKFRITSA